MAGNGFDFVIVGGGSSGCVIANRLSENPAARVLLLEAGGTDGHYLIHMPVGFAKMTDGPHTWGFLTAPQFISNYTVNTTAAGYIAHPVSLPRNTRPVLVPG